MNQRERITRRNQIEYDLQYRLDNVLEKIKNRNIKDTGNAQRLFSGEVDRTIRAGTEDAYQLGIDYVTDKRKTVGFITSNDLKIIQDQTTKYALRFWLKVDKLIHRNDVLLQKYNYEPRSPLNSNYMATVTAVAVVTTTLALATRQKVLTLQSHIKGAAISQKCPKGKHWDKDKRKCVNDELDLAPPLPPITADTRPADEMLDDMLNALPVALTSMMFLAPDEYGDLQIQDQQISRFILIWNAVLDNRTCPTCESLDGTEWSPDAPNLPTPGDDGDIHANCRCFFDVQEVFG